MSFTIGSLFDGSGGFPLAATMCGGTPKWSSEIEPYPIAVTKSRFPSIKHLGSVTDIKGGEVEPVDVITFGSPCQDLSVAGKRAGLKHTDNGDDETTRSGLFMEAVRIIKEMREATNGVYPRFALWENVPGAFSSNKGEDFRIVLEELIKIVEPTAVMPEVPKNGWPYADSYRGDGWSLAYRVLDAQFWGVPQRRRRIYLVADFRGECAGKVSFERDGLRGYFTEGRTPWQAAPGDAEGGSGATDREGKCYGIVSKGNGEAWSIEEKHMALSCGGGQAGQGYPCVMEPVVAVDQGGGKSGANFHNNLSPTLTCTHGGEPAVAYPYTLKIRSGCEGGGKGALIQTDKSATLSTLNDQYLFQPVGIIDSIGGQAERGWEGDTAPCLKASHYKFAPCVAIPQKVYSDSAGCNGKEIQEDVCYTLNTIDRPTVAYGTDVGWFNSTENQSPTLLARQYKDPHLVCYAESGTNGSQISNTLVASMGNAPTGTTQDNLFVRINYIVRRLTPTECARLQGFPDKWGHPDIKTEFTDDEYQFWMNVRNTHAIINDKATKEYTKDQILKWYNGLHTDSSEYKMWGNGIALPNALYVMQGIAEVMSEEKAARRKWLDELLGDCI